MHIPSLYTLLPSWVAPQPDVNICPNKKYTEQTRLMDCIVAHTYLQKLTYRYCRRIHWWGQSKKLHWNSERI